MLFDMLDENKTSTNTVPNRNQIALALPKGKEIASEEDPVTNTIAPVRVANDPGTT